MRFRHLALALFASSWPAIAQDRLEAPPSQCLATAQQLPSVHYAAYTSAEAVTDGAVTITHAGHSTYVIETPGGVRVATDFSGYYGADPLPRVVTMNKAYRTHYTELQSPEIGCAHGADRRWHHAVG